jgi:hypothetical protein
MSQQNKFSKRICKSRSDFDAFKEFEDNVSKKPFKKRAKKAIRQEGKHQIRFFELNQFD